LIDLRYARAAANRPALFSKSLRLPDAEEPASCPRKLQSPAVSLQTLEVDFNLHESALSISGAIGGRMKLFKTIH